MYRAIAGFQRLGRTEIAIITVNGKQIASQGPYTDGEFTITGTTLV